MIRSSLEEQYVSQYLRYYGVSPSHKEVSSMSNDDLDRAIRRIDESIVGALDDLPYDEPDEDEDESIWSEECRRIAGSFDDE
jgi:hypothetical protein